MIALLILSPFLVAPVAGAIAARRPAWTAWLAAWPALLAAAFAAALPEAVAGRPRLAALSWAPSLGLSLSFQLDGLGLLFAILITAVGALVVAYASAYLRGHEHAGRFHASLFAFMGAMLGVVLADNVLALFVFWELTGFTSFLLIGFDHQRAQSRAAAVQALIVTGGGGLALLAAAILLGPASGTLNLSAMGGERAEAIAAHPFAPAIAGLVLLAAFTKSAQTPFHFWLPNAMAAPTPVSAYLHSATMVKAGVYLVARMTPILGGVASWTTTVTIVGAVTMAVGAWRGVQETDLKRVLAYSTISALGVMMLLLGLGTRDGAVAALAYLLAHASYKGALFLVAGAIEHETGTRDVTALGGLRRTMPFTAAAAALAAASMAGVPLLLGFVGKEGLYEAVLHAEGRPMVLLALAAAASALLGLAGLVAGFAPFAGRPGSARAAHDAPLLLWLPPLALAVAGLLGGIAPWMLNRPLGAAAASILRAPANVSLSLWHGFTPVLLLSVLTLLGVAALYRARGWFQRSARPRSFGTERLYTGLVAGLRRVSGAIAPPLHSASLRSYVLTVVVTGGVLIASALAAGGFTRGYGGATDVRAHELALGLVICGGAVAAALATSSMAAVLSLGVVGYGIALIFVSFGAPDLAMTQFSIETLTVVIFVLVFRHFPRFGVLSTRAVIVRDALASGAIGAVIGALVLFVGVSDTPSRLAGYFVENAPTLAHGRNVVNVILVDFRAFDTLGEITVLVSAAIGVRALLRLGAQDRAGGEGGEAPR